MALSQEEYWRTGAVVAQHVDAALALVDAIRYSPSDETNLVDVARRVNAGGVITELAGDLARERTKPAHEV